MALRKESTVDKKERGVENCLLQFIFCLRDFNLASYARVIDIGAIESLLHPSCCLGNFAEYGREVHEGDRDNRSQSQNEERPSLLSRQGTSARFRRNLPH